jgi:hypothetical protein
MSQTLQQQQGEIDLALVKALIKAIPKEWDAALLRAQRLPTSTADESSYRIAIQRGTEPGGPSADPTDDVLLQVRRLDLLFQQHGTPWKAIRYAAQRDAAGGWDFRANFDY